MKRSQDVLCSSADTFVQRSHDLDTRNTSSLVKG